MLKFIIATDHTAGMQALADKISAFLRADKKVLWLIPGGSNIPIAVEAMKRIRSTTEAVFLKNLTITLTDERYGPVGHSDSNWQQLQDAGFDMNVENAEDIKMFPILYDLPLVETVARFGRTIQEILAHTDVVVGQFGMGADGHIAGILPGSPAVSELTPTSGYESKPFTRISLTFPILRQIDVAYLFVSGVSKRAATERLHEDGVSLNDQPAQILKEIPEVYVYHV
jgi:6-phosphogluconolactonase/glucosamine-6-phosphate isomerase/deaminase